MVQLLSTLAIGTEKKLQMPIRPVRFGLECWMPTAASLRRNAMLAFPYEHHLLEPA
jgi:IS4 transposase